MKWINEKTVQGDPMDTKNYSLPKEERHGHWEYNPKDAFEVMYELPKCSVCGHESSDALNYCSNCGALMDEVEEDEIN